MHLFIRTFLLCAILGLLGPSTACAADTPGAYNFRSYGVDQGLRNQAVNDLAQDKQGFIYAGTEDGLFRYDGNRFEHFGTANGLLADSIVALYREPGGRLWVINEKGAQAWAGDQPDPTVKTGLLPNLRISSISASLAGDLLVATAEGYYDGQPDRLVPVDGLPKEGTGAAWMAPDGGEALAAVQGKLYQRSGRGAWASRALPSGNKTDSIFSILKDAQGRIWLSGRHLLLRLASFNGAIEDLSAQLPGPSVQAGTLVTDSLGRVWASTNVGVVRFDDKGIWLLGEHQGLPTQSANAVLFDQEDNLWVGSEGVHRVQGRLAWTTQTRRQKLPSDTVWSVYRSRDGALWAGTNRGLAHSTEKEWELVPDTRDRSFYAFAEDVEGNLWVGGNRGKNAKNALLLRASGASSFRPVALENLDGPVTINSMAFGADHALYIGTQGHGLRRLVRDGKGYSEQAVVLPQGEPKEQINQVLGDAQGRLWVAGMAGLAYFDGSQWRRYLKADGLLENAVEALALDSAGDLLVSYWNIHGLTRFKVKPTGLEKASTGSVPETLVADNIYSLGFDAKGALWLGTAQGAKRWKDGRLDQYGRADGLPSEDAAANGFWADANGDVWFGMANGLAHYHAQAGQLAPPMPPTHILQVQDGSGKILTSAAPRVEWNDRALTFHFAVLSYVNESRIRPQVRLVGFEDTWRDTDIREARYTGLPPGHYRFEVRASLGGDQYGPADAREVVILAPWWRTGWAMALAALGTAAVVFLFVRWRLAWLNRRNSELEALVRARTEALEKANAALHEASIVDALTGLKNRRFLGLSMPSELARVCRQFHTTDDTRTSMNKTLLFFMLDLDQFKAVNDKYGHAAGDLVLQQTSMALSKACRDADFVVRWGGEEFLIVARNTDRNCAEILADKLRNAVRNLEFDLGNGVILKKTCSLGFSAFPVFESAPDAHTWEDVVKMADQCLYAAKNSGRDAWVGVILPADTTNTDIGPRMTHVLGRLVAEGRIQAMSSLPNGAALVWQ